MAGTIRLNGVPCATAIYSSPSLLPALSADPSAPPFLWLGRCGGGGPRGGMCDQRALGNPRRGGESGGGLLPPHVLSPFCYYIQREAKKILAASFSN